MLLPYCKCSITEFTLCNPYAHMVWIKVYNPSENSSPSRVIVIILSSHNQFQVTLPIL